VFRGEIDACAGPVLWGLRLSLTPRFAYPSITIFNRKYFLSKAKSHGGSEATDVACPAREAAKSFARKAHSNSILQQL
jgi:hypothetical protein